MRFITHFVEAQLHREVYVAILNGLLRTPGDKRAFAQRVGISPVYLSYLLALDDDDHHYPTLRTPSSKIAQRIAQVIAAPPEIRESLLQHMLLANDKCAEAQRELACHDAVNAHAHEAVLGIVHLRRRATFAADANVTRRLYRAAAHAATHVLQRLNPRSHLIQCLDVANILCDCQHVLNRHDQVLWHTKRACALIDHLSPHTPSFEREFVVAHHMNMLRMQAVAYTALEDCRRAVRLLDQARSIAPQVPDEVDWHFLVLRDKINAMARLPRFAISEVEMLADAAQSVAIRSKQQAGLFLLLLAESLANAYLQHGNVKKARAVLSEQEPQLNQLSLIGPVHRVMFLRACARLHDAMGSRDGWAHYISEALRIATAAGLTHQQVSIERDMASSG